ncbi:MAG TPA: asparagine synthase-related protein [Terriglobales bacterium]|nr:asparagine synthase-related protein [Terriglobales bacterium]
MPGLFGIIRPIGSREPRGELEAMQAELRHEAFYRSGAWSEPNAGVRAGWVARERSFSDTPPLRNETGEITLLFAGEEFPDPGLRGELRRRGHSVESEGPDYLVHRYEEEGDFPRQLNGRFHGLAVDARRGTAILFNDRYGLQPVYFHEAPEGFYFACEAKAILAARPELREFDPRALGEYIACGCVLENRTLFPGIGVLPPGSAWRFERGRLAAKTTYFEPQEWEQQEPLDEEAYYRLLRDSFEGTLPRYFEGRERIAVSLTGGLDTRIIMAWRRAAPGALPCYTYGSAYRDNQDVKLARRVAALCGQTHATIPVDDEFLGRFAHYAERTLYLTEGGVDTSRAPDLYVSEEARKIAPVRMVGTYGSEIINGAVMFKAQEPAAPIFSREFMAQARTARETYANARQSHPATFIAFRQSPWHHYGVLGLEQTQLAVRSPYLDNAVVQAVYRAPADAADPRPRLIREMSPVLGRLRTDRGLGARGLLGALQRLYLEFTFKAEYAYDMGMPQWVAAVDHAFAPLRLERLWLGRHKVYHFRIWFRTALRRYVQDVLLDPAALARPYVNRAAVEEIVRRHLKGDRNYTDEIHRLLSLELLHRLFVDAGAKNAAAGAALAAR